MSFKELNARILVLSDVFGRGIDIARVSFVVTCYFPDDSDQYLHSVGCAGCLAATGLPFRRAKSLGGEHSRVARQD